MRILVVSPRVAPGILTLEAWDALRAVDRVLSAEDGPHVHGIRSAGIEVEVSARRPDGDGADVLWIAPPGDLAWARDLAESLVASSGSQSEGPHVEVILGSHDLPGARLLDLVAVMDRLRRECPWTRQQTHESLAPYVLEEAQETFEALESGDTEHLGEELGDLLMQVVFHAAVASEGTPDDPDGWDIDDVAAGITAKLVRRNPHVFGDAVVTSADEVDAQWNRIKAEEKQRNLSWRTAPVSHPGSVEPHD
jgi:XTP/dITP diphosphohydrolase